MAYWLDEGWHSWPEIVRAGTAAAGLYARCGAYIADQATDGFVPAEVARMFGTPEWVQRLVDVGLWRIEGDGFVDTRYLELNKTKAQIDKAKADAAMRQRRHRHGKPKAVPNARDQGKASRVTNALQPRDSRVSHATPTLPLKGGRAGAGAPPPAPSPTPPAAVARGDVEIDWRKLPDFGDVPAPEVVARVRRGAAVVRGVLAGDPLPPAQAPPVKPPPAPPPEPAEVIAVGATPVPLPDVGTAAEVIQLSEHRRRT